MSERSAVLTATSRRCGVVLIAVGARKYIERYRQREERRHARRATPKALALAGQKHAQLIETRVCDPRASALS